MYLETAVARILQSDHVAGIDFDLNGLHITGAGFGRVATLVEQGHIRVQVHREMCAAAAYDPGHNRNIIKLPTRRVSDRDIQLAIVHESTHALCDLNRARGYVYVEESAAYLAEAIFDRLAPPQDGERQAPRPRSQQCGSQQREMLEVINERRRAARRRLRPRNRPINAGAPERIKSAAVALIERHDLDVPGSVRWRIAWNDFAALRAAVASAGSYEYAQLPASLGGRPSRYRNDGIERRPNVYPARALQAL